MYMVPQKTAENRDYTVYDNISNVTWLSVGTGLIELKLYLPSTTQK